MGQIKSPPRVLDEFTERQYLETTARSILNKASPEFIPSKLFKPTAYKSEFEFNSESQKSRYFKIMKELQMIKSRIVTNPATKYETCKGLILLHTRYTPSKDEIRKFMSFIMDERVVPSGMNLKDTIFYMLTYDQNFDLVQSNEYGMKMDQPKTSNVTANNSQRFIQSHEKPSKSMFPSPGRDNLKGFKSHRRLFSNNSSSRSSRQVIYCIRHKNITKFLNFMNKVTYNTKNSVLFSMIFVLFTILSIYSRNRSIESRQNNM